MATMGSLRLISPRVFEECVNASSQPFFAQVLKGKPVVAKIERLIEDVFESREDLRSALMTLFIEEGYVPSLMIHHIEVITNTLIAPPPLRRRNAYYGIILASI